MDQYQRDNAVHTVLLPIHKFDFHWYA